MNTASLLSWPTEQGSTKPREESLKSVASQMGSGLKGIVSLKRVWRERRMEFEKLDRGRCWILIRVC